jgi:PTS system galactitol-specific IIB component
MKIKKIVVACGSGVATSQTVASKLQSMCDDAKVRVNVEAIDMKGLETTLRSSDIYVSITPNFHHSRQILHKQPDHI